MEARRSTGARLIDNLSGQKQSSAPVSIEVDSVGQVSSTAISDDARRHEIAVRTGSRTSAETVPAVSQDDAVNVKELRQSLTGFQTAVSDLVFDYSLAESDDAEIDPISGINRIATALAHADATEISLRAELSQLRAQTSELADVKLSLDAAAQEKSARDAVIKDLERKLQEFDTMSRRQSETSESDREMPSPSGPGLRMSFGRAATPTSKIPPIQPPPNVPPPPLPPLPEGLPTIQRHNSPGNDLQSAAEQKGQAPTPTSPIEAAKLKVEDDNQALRRQIAEHERTIAELNTKIKTSHYGLEEVIYVALDCIHSIH